MSNKSTATVATTASGCERQGGCTLCAPSLPIIHHPIQCPVATMVRTIEDLAGDWRRLDERIQALSDEIKSVAITTWHQVSQSLRKLNSLSLIIIVTTWQRFWIRVEPSKVLLTNISRCPQLTTKLTYCGRAISSPKRLKTVPAALWNGSFSYA